MTTQIINLMTEPVTVRDHLGNLNRFDPIGFIPKYEVKSFVRERTVPFLSGYRADAVKDIIISNLPPYDPYKAYVVSLPHLVMAANQDRYDMFSPDYNNKPVKQGGEVLGISRFIFLKKQGDFTTYDTLPPFMLGGQMPPPFPFDTDNNPSVSDTHPNANQKVFVQPTRPVGAIPPYIWMKTGLGPSGTEFELLFEDGSNSNAS